MHSLANIVIVLAIIYVLYRIFIKKEFYQDIMKIEQEKVPTNIPVYSIGAIPPRNTYCW